MSSVAQLTNSSSMIVRPRRVSVLGGRKKVSSELTRTRPIVSTQKTPAARNSSRNTKRSRTIAAAIRRMISRCPVVFSMALFLDKC